MSDAEAQRLIQAVEHFQARTRGGDLPKGAQEAVDGLLKVFGSGGPARDTPGSREAHKVAPGTDGTGEPMARAAIGRDGPSPGQREARSISQEIQEAAESIVSKAA